MTRDVNYIANTQKFTIIIEKKKLATASIISIYAENIFYVLYLY